MTVERSGPGRSGPGPDESINSTEQGTSASPPFVPIDLPAAAAFQYASRGLPVLPVHWVTDGACSCHHPDCGSAGKHPMTPRGVLDASTAEEMVRHWWTVHPAANVGVATGARSGLVVLDVDPRSGGDESLEALEEKHDRLPDTPQVLTGGGGRHLYFQHPGGRVPSRPIRPGLDVKADGGFVVAPPSVHASGGRYEWEVSSVLGVVPLAPLPDWLREIVCTDPGPVPADGGADRRLDPALVLAGVREGQRDQTLFRYACSLRTQDRPRPEAEVLVLAAARACQPPFDDRLALRKVEQAWGYPAGRAGDGDRPRFPILWGEAVEHLPEPEWLVHDLLVRGSLAVLYGEPGVGKSFVALDLACCVAAGLAWHGRTVHQGPVLYIAAEGVGDLGLRVAAWREAHGGVDLPNLGVIIQPVNLFDGGGTDLAAQLLEDLDRDPPVLILFDTLPRSMEGADESSAKDMGRVVAQADRLRHTTGATVLPVHHPGHDKSRERGSSALKGAADCFIRLTRDKQRPLSLTLTCEKQKTAAAFDPIPLELVEAADSLAVKPEQVSPLLDLADRNALRLVPPEGITNTAWQKAFQADGQGSESTFDRRRGDLLAKGAVVKQGSGRGARYLLTDLGKEADGVTGIR